MKRTALRVVILVVGLVLACSGDENKQTLREATFRVSGINCIVCASRLRDALIKIEGVEDVEVSVKTKEVKVYFDPSLVGTKKIIDAIEGANFRVVSVQGGRKDGH